MATTRSQRVTSPWLLKSLCLTVICITCPVAIRCSWNMQISWTGMKCQTSSKTDQMGSLILSYIPLIAEKASVWLCHQRNLFSFDLIFLKPADMVDMDKISNNFINWLDQIISLRVMSPWLLKKPLFDFVISITNPVLVRSSWNLQIRWTWMKSQTCL